MSTSLSIAEQYRKLPKYEYTPLPDGICHPFVENARRLREKWNPTPTIHILSSEVYEG